MSTRHVTTTDWSPYTGAVVVCACGEAIGPFMERQAATRAAAAHRAAYSPPRAPRVLTDAQQERQRDAQRAARDRKREARDERRRRKAEGES